MQTASADQRLGLPLKFLLGSTEYEAEAKCTGRDSRFGLVRPVLAQGQLEFQNQMAAAARHVRRSQPAAVYFCHEGTNDCRSADGRRTR